MDSEKQIVSLCPKAEVEVKDGRFHVTVELGRMNEEKCDSDYEKRQKWLDIGGTQYYYCNKCNGSDHNQHGKISRELTHPLHPKHPLQLVYLRQLRPTKECFCCEKLLAPFFYYCPVCEFSMNIGCVNKTTYLSIDHRKKHEHTLVLFPRQTSLTCNVCALDNSRGPIYMCPPCDFVVHKSCLNLPRVIKISRHRHRITFKHSFDFGDCSSCGVCRKRVNSDYGGYSCNKEGCSYVAHSRCATRKNLWDGKELEGIPEATDALDDEREPYVKIGDGIIRHFRHEHHLLKLDEDTGRVYNENKRCQACIMPIYDGNFYSCMQCDFILHEICANLSRTTHHAMHPHPLKLVAQYDDRFNPYNTCSACYQPCTGFMYKCYRRRCDFRLHLQCATIFEPFVHESHTDPLFLTSEPGERRLCRICKNFKETFNCIVCDFSLCFICAILPHKVKYKHDEHLLSLSYGEEISGTYWCEVCESKIHEEERFYKCDECCVTIHKECLPGKHLYIKPGSYVCHKGDKIDVLLNNHMSRPSCIRCSNRCQDKLVFKYSRSLSFCSLHCFAPCVLNLK